MERTIIIALLIILLSLLNIAHAGYVLEDHYGRSVSMHPSIGDGKGKLVIYVDEGCNVQATFTKGFRDTQLSAAESAQVLSYFWNNREVVVGGTRFEPYSVIPALQQVVPECFS